MWSFLAFEKSLSLVLKKEWAPGSKKSHKSPANRQLTGSAVCTIFGEYIGIC